MYACLPEYQKKYSADSFKSYLREVGSVLKNRVQHGRLAASKYSSRSEKESEDDGAEARFVSETKGLLSAVLSAHLVLCRVAVLYPWREPFVKDPRLLIQDEVSRLAGTLVDAWDLLGVLGEARRLLLQRLIGAAGEKTLDARRQINEAYHQQSEDRRVTVGDRRGSAALRETEGEDRRL